MAVAELAGRFTFTLRIVLAVMAVVTLGAALPVHRMLPAAKEKLSTGVRPDTAAARVPERV
ncbi:hypothetical protein [Streptomyces sp. H27-C3]|uniref:hypothetical protein n=1 Tax=Streptomyces sp. H27-C3 TaxID=3046305 RepID=UPI0024B8A97A|nr:hypothetical protein [Streptomyces sp. H27-C3]MDJ0461253.1 hypothetical protein [Streptomyces sp. H27-C3]